MRSSTLIMIWIYHFHEENAKASTTDFVACNATESFRRLDTHFQQMKYSWNGMEWASNSNLAAFSDLVTFKFWSLMQVPKWMTWFIRLAPIHILIKSHPSYSLAEKTQIWTIPRRLLHRLLFHHCSAIHFIIVLHNFWGVVNAVVWKPVFLFIKSFIGVKFHNIRQHSNVQFESTLLQILFDSQSQRHTELSPLCYCLLISPCFVCKKRSKEMTFQR